jgi:hypothetical protein
MQITSKNPFTGQAPHKRVLQLQNENPFSEIVRQILSPHPPNPSKRKLRDFEKNSAKNTPPNKQ